MCAFIAYLNKSSNGKALNLVHFVWQVWQLSQNDPLAFNKLRGRIVIWVFVVRFFFFFFLTVFYFKSFAVCEIKD